MAVRRGTTARLRIAVLTAVVAVLATASPVHAAGSTPLPDLGLPASMELTGPNAERTLSLPFDAAAPPTRLDMTIEKAFDDPDGTLEVWLGDARLVRFAVTSPEPTPQAIDLAGRVPFGADATTLDLRFVSRFPSTDGYCRGRANAPRVLLGALFLTTADNLLPPTSIGTFFPSRLRTVSVWIPPEPSVPVASAVLRVAAGVAARYRGQNLVLDVRPLPDDGSLIARFDPLHRDVVIRAEDSRKAALVDAAGPAEAPAKMLVIPSGDALSSVEGVFSSLVPMASGPEAEFRQRPGDPLVPLLEQRLIDLGAPTTAVVGAADVAFSLSVPQASFGGDVFAYVLRLKGIAKVDHPATLTVTVNGQLVTARRVNGAFSIRQRLTGPLVGRFTNLSIAVSEIGRTGRCTTRDANVALQLSSESTLRAELGVPRHTNWSVLPQTLLPVVDVAMSPMDVSTINAAAAVVHDLGQAAPHGIGTTIVERATVARSERPALVIQSGRTKALPHMRTLADRDVPSFRLRDRVVHLGADTAVAQIVRSRQRHIVVLSAADSDDVAAFTHSIVDFPGELARHSGDTVVRIGNANADFQVAPVPEFEEDIDYGLAPTTKLWILSAVLVVAALAAAGWRGRSRR